LKVPDPYNKDKSDAMRSRSVANLRGNFQIDNMPPSYRSNLKE
jgi:hypothetical protein